MSLINRVSRAQTVITITESAKSKIKDLLLEENNPQLALRTFVQGGGCSGFSYGFTFDEETNEDDFEVPLDEFRVLVDSMSMQYLTGAEIDYKEDVMGSSFSIRNPNAQTTCGCGSSFGV
jgi:iron-sulfur cluster insertion protein